MTYAQKIFSRGNLRRVDEFFQRVRCAKLYGTNSTEGDFRNAVPTSVGYGASFGGLAALLAMLNSCAAGVSVVNIDNGFGAGVLASKINRVR